MSEVTTIGLDIAKNVFHAHGADASGSPVFSRKISRAKLLEFFAKQPRCLVALEACGGAHHWARELTVLGHEVKLIPPAYVKPFVKRNKNDAVDAEAICEAAQRPNMRFVAIKSEEQQASALVFRTRDLMVRQRTQLINAIRGHLTEYGWVAPKGPSHIAVLSNLLDGEIGSSLPDAATPMFRTMLDLLEILNGRISELDKEITRRAREDVIAKRLMTIPGVGPITATAIAALAPPVETFTKGRDFAAWLGLAPRQLSTGGKQKLGSITKMGERTLRRLIIIGCSAVVLHASKRGAPAGSWLEQMMARKPRMLVTVALANKTARIIWAVLMKQEEYKAPVAAAA
jgi:transposase